MTQAFIEGRLVFTFPDDWTILRFDGSHFHRDKWNSFALGSKAVDFIACGTDCDVWLIEVKDYSRDRRTKPSDLFDELAQKVRDSLAGLKVLSYQGADSDEKAIAQRVLNGSSCFRIVFHLEQPEKPSKLFPQVIDWKTAKDKIRQKLRVIDPHGNVGNRGLLNAKMKWQVTSAQAGEA